MADHKTDTDGLVERLEDSKGWPNLGKAAAARIRADAEVIKAAEALADQCETAFDNVDGGAPPAFYNALDGLNRAMQGRKGGE